jgi:hypothetical protein
MICTLILCHPARTWKKRCLLCTFLHISPFVCQLDICSMFYLQRFVLLATCFCDSSVASSNILRFPPDSDTRRRQDPTTAPGISWNIARNDIPTIYTIARDRALPKEDSRKYLIQCCVHHAAYTTVPCSQQCATCPIAYYSQWSTSSSRPWQ